MKGLNMLYLYLMATFFAVMVMSVEFFMSFWGNADHEGDHALESGHHEGASQIEGDAEGESSTDASEHSSSRIPLDISKEDLISLQDKEGSFLRVILRMLSWMRMFVYFSLGFGFSGLFAIYLGETSLSGFLWALGLGLTVVFLYKTMNRVLRQEINSVIKEEELLLRNGTIIVSVKKGQLGKVEIEWNQQSVERYCRSFLQEEEFKVGDQVLIAKVTDECVYVEKKNLY